MAYKYRTRSNNSGYIEFNISPDIYAGGAVTTDDVVTITGIVHNTWGKIIDMEVRPYYNSTQLSYSKISFSSDRGSEKGFTAIVPIRDYSSKISSGRSISLRFAFSMVIGPANSATRIELDTSSYFTYVKYRLEPSILDFRLERCNSSGAADNEGAYLRCAMLKLSKSAKASASDYSVCQFSWKSETGATGSFSASGPFSQALTSSGYKETGSPSANLFGTRQFLTTTDYNVTLTVGDAYDTYSVTVVVPRAFAILHLSGAANGGVAVGMFSSATDQQPKFEVAQSHQSIFYGPVDFQGKITGITNGDYTSGEVATGGHWIDGKPIYRYVAYFTSKTSGPTISNINEMISMYGAVKNSSNLRWMPLPMTSATSVGNQVQIFVESDGKITVGTDNNKFTTGPYIVIVDYTKK